MQINSKKEKKQEEYEKSYCRFAQMLCMAKMKKT